MVSYGNGGLGTVASNHRETTRIPQAYCLTSQHDPYLSGSRSSCVSEPERCAGKTGVGGRKGPLEVKEMVDGFTSQVRKPGNRSFGSHLISISTAEEWL
jgi:hypothetical protein